MTDDTPTVPLRFTHRDGRVCYWLAYSRDGMAGLLHGYFTGLPPDMRKCQRAHGLQGREDQGEQSP
jgi:hypothetical protein